MFFLTQVHEMEKRKNYGCSGLRCWKYCGGGGAWCWTSNWLECHSDIFCANRARDPGSCKGSCGTGKRSQEAVESETMEKRNMILRNMIGPIGPMTDPGEVIIQNNGSFKKKCQQNCSSVFC